MADGTEDLELWDPAATAYAGRSDGFYRRIRGFLWDRIGDIRGLAVLDLGCGDGWLAEEMRRAGARVTCVDGSAALLARARSRYPAIEFEQHDLVLGLPWPCRQYDRIVAHMVLMDRAARTAVISLYRSLGYAEAGPCATGTPVPMIYMDRPITTADLLD